MRNQPSPKESRFSTWLNSPATYAGLYDGAFAKPFREFRKHQVNYEYGRLVGVWFRIHAGEATRAALAIREVSAQTPALEKVWALVFSRTKYNPTKVR